MPLFMTKIYVLPQKSDFSKYRAVLPQELLGGVAGSHTRKACKGGRRCPERLAVFVCSKDVVNRYLFEETSNIHASTLSTIQPETT